MHRRASGTMLQLSRRLRGAGFPEAITACAGVLMLACERSVLCAKIP